MLIYYITLPIICQLCEGAGTGCYLWGKAADFSGNTNSCGGDLSIIIP